MINVHMKLGLLSIGFVNCYKCSNYFFLYILKYYSHIPAIYGSTIKGAGPASRQTPSSVITLKWSNCFILRLSTKKSSTSL